MTVVSTILEYKLFVCLFVCLMVFNATFNNIAVISWWSVLSDLSQVTDKLYHIRSDRDSNSQHHCKTISSRLPEFIG